MLHVLAGTYQQAVYAMRGRPPREWRYVYEPRHLYGTRGGRYVIVGTFWERRDAAEIMDLVEINGLVRGATEETA